MSEQTTQGQETGQECAWCATGYPTATQARGIVHLLPGGIEVRCYRGAPVFAASPTPRSGGVPTREEVERALHLARRVVEGARRTWDNMGRFDLDHPLNRGKMPPSLASLARLIPITESLRAAALAGEQDRERLDRLEKLVPVHIGFEGDGFESERIELVEERGNVNDRQFTSIAVADTLREAIDALLAARQPRPEGTTTTTED